MRVMRTRRQFLKATGAVGATPALGVPRTFADLTFLRLRCAWQRS